MLRYRRSMILGILSALLLGPARTHAQTPDMAIRLRDAADQPLAGVTVIIRDQAGTRDLAQTVTDREGAAGVTGLTAETVRVAVVGQLPDGTPLVQLGDDAPGMLVFLVGGTLTLDLVSDAQGVVQPNPLTMTALEPGIPRETPLPTAPFSTPVPTLVAVPLVGNPTIGIGLGPDPVLPAPPAPGATGTTWGLVLLGGLVALGVGMLVLIQRGRTV